MTQTDSARLRDADGTVYTFTTPTRSYELMVEERDDPHDRFCVTTLVSDGKQNWNSDSELRGAIGVAVMRIIRFEAEQEAPHD